MKLRRELINFITFLEDRGLMKDEESDRLYIKYELAEDYLDKQNECSNGCGGICENDVCTSCGHVK